MVQFVEKNWWLHDTAPWLRRLNNIESSTIWNEELDTCHSLDFSFCLTHNSSSTNKQVHWATNQKLELRSLAAKHLWLTGVIWASIFNIVWQFLLLLVCRCYVVSGISPLPSLLTINAASKENSLGFFRKVSAWMWAASLWMWQRLGSSMTSEGSLSTRYCCVAFLASLRFCSSSWRLRQ